MALLKRLFVGAAVVFLTLPGSARSAGDRAAFEVEIAKIAQGLSRPNPITFLVGLGDLYCQMKRERGGRPLDVQVAIGEFHRAHPESLRSADDIMAQDFAMASAAKLLCPD